MAEKTKEEEIKQKLLDFFDKKLSDLTTKFQTDIDSIEKMKYEYFDSVIKKYEEIENEHKKQEEQEKEKNEKEKSEKKEEPKHEKVVKKKIDPLARPKTPLASSKKPKIKEDKPHDKTEIHKEKKEAKPKTTGTKPAGAKPAAGKKSDTSKRPVTSKADPKSKTITKKGGANAKKVDPKKGKKVAKKTNDKKEEDKKEEEEEHHEEEKKPVIINPKYIHNISDELKSNLGISCLYLVIKGKYIDDKKKLLHITTNSPLLYKSTGSSMKYLLDDKKKEVQAKADEIEKFLNNYGDLNTYLTKEFSISKKAINSIQFFKKKEEEEILKMPEIPKEVGMVLKCIYYLIDENFDENMGNKELFENMLNNILTKNEDKTFKSLLVNYFNQNKYLNLTKEKFDKINNLINDNNTILNMIAMTKLSRPVSLFCFLLKEVYDYINLKTLDGQYYFDLRTKNNELQKYKDFLYLIENNGKPREPPKEEKPKVEGETKIEEKPLAEVVSEQQKTEEPQKTEEKPKAEGETKIEEKPLAEVVSEQPKTEDAPKIEENQATEGGEQPKE